ncbi:MAG: dimethylsulfonioproprionate lyase family protein [Pikeienuella sp.]
MTLDTIFDHCYDYLDQSPDCTNYAAVLASAKKSNARGPAPLAKKDAGHVAAHLPEMDEYKGDGTAKLVSALTENYQLLDWWNAYDDDTPSGEGFKDATASSLLVGPGAPFTSKTGRAGFFYLRNGLTYAPHNHAPDEIYAILAGQADFWSESDGWRRAGPGEIIHTPSWSWHGMKTQNGPVLILWAWTGGGLDTEPSFEGAPNW